MNKLKEISKHLTKVTNANEIEEIVKAYVIECSKASLKRASFNSIIRISITSEENIVLL